VFRTLFITVIVPSAESRLRLLWLEGAVPEEGLKETCYYDEEEEEKHGGLLQHFFQDDDHCSEKSIKVEVQQLSAI
jgi:hypothetical protein